MLLVIVSMLLFVVGWLIGAIYGLLLLRFIDAPPYLWVLWGMSITLSFILVALGECLKIKKDKGYDQ